MAVATNVERALARRRPCLHPSPQKLVQEASGRRRAWQPGQCPPPPVSNVPCGGSAMPSLPCSTQANGDACSLTPPHPTPSGTPPRARHALALAPGRRLEPPLPLAARLAAHAVPQRPRHTHARTSPPAGTSSCPPASQAGGVKLAGSCQAATSARGACPGRCRFGSGFRFGCGCSGRGLLLGLPRQLQRPLTPPPPRPPPACSRLLGAAAHADALRGAAVHLVQVGALLRLPRLLGVA